MSKNPIIVMILIAAVFVMAFSSAIAASNKQVAVTSGPAEKTTIHADFGTAESMSGKFEITEGDGFEQKALAFFASRRASFKMNQPARELEMISERTDDLGRTHVRFQQVYEGLPVWGCQTIVHFENERTIYLAGGQTIPTPELNIIPAFSETQVADLAASALKDQVIEKNIESEIETVIYPNDGDPRLTQIATITSPDNGAVRWRVFVDAQTGEILYKFNDIHFDGPDVGSGPDTRDSVRNFNIYQTGGVYQMYDVTHNAWIVTYDNYYAGGPVSTDPDNDKVWDDNNAQKAEVAGHYYVQLTYEYYWNTFGRDSYDDAGSQLIVNIHDPVYVNNAYWNGQALNFADGDGVNFLPFSGSLDVVAHELTHGVTEYSAGLIYQFQSGALNESYSDVFGAMVDRDDWLLGEEIGILGNYIRSMQDPNLKGHPKHMNDYRNYDINTDNGGVHVNSGIPNHAYYLTATQIGRDKAEQIWYRTLTTYLTPSSGFYFWAGMTIQSAIDLYGASSPEVIALEGALAGVGLGTAYASPDLVQTGALIGEIASDEIWIYNPGTSTGSVNVTAIPTSIPGLQITGGTYYQENIPDGDSSQFIITYDALALDECNVGFYSDSIGFEVDGPYGITYIKLPMTVTVGLTSRSVESEYFNTSCVNARTYNTSSMDYFSRSGNDVLYDASLMVGMIDGASYSVYRDIFENQSFSPVDTIGTDVGMETFRIASEDGRIQGTVTYSYDTEDPANCDFIVVDYALYNICDTALNVLVGMVADFDIDNSAANQTGYDDPRSLVYMNNSGNTRAAGMALLSETARNMRGLYNPSLIYDGSFTDAVAYSEMFSSNNTSGTSSNDWSALLTFGDALIGPGDTIQYRAALVYSNSGSSGLADIVDRAADWAAGPVYVCGDADGSEGINILDVTTIINYLYKGGPTPDPIEAGDANASGGINILDVTHIINYLYKGGPAPICP